MGLKIFVIRGANPIRLTDSVLSFTTRDAVVYVQLGTRLPHDDYDDVSDDDHHDHRDHPHCRSGTDLTPLSPPAPVSFHRRCSRRPRTPSHRRQYSLVAVPAVWQTAGRSDGNALISARTSAQNSIEDTTEGARGIVTTCVED